MDEIRKKLDIAIIVPVLDDLAALENLQWNIQNFRSSPREVVVVSGGKAPEVAARCADHGHRYLETAANRGGQLDQGARSASASVLWFVHASAELGPAALDAVQSAIEGGAESGCFRFAFQGPASWRKRFISWLVGLRLRTGGIPYGDQALFATRQAYLDTGGFTHDPLFEEIKFVRLLRKRRSFVTLHEAVYVSPRRWERDGWIQRSLHNRWLAVCRALGVSAERLNATYRKSAQIHGAGGS